ncbi:MAG: serine/threonine protein kinase [Oscillatoriales cyanobacterium RM2_1_1]|nr:serine/threonine protein kinase [Oscillatoriales cyanobacterium RM2_1_1]
MKSSGSTPQSPDRLLKNRYRILTAISSGGFGETFLAEDTQMPSQRRCVIKQLKPAADHSEIYPIIQARFQREATILERLGEICPQIPRLYAYFEDEGQFYLVQEWIEGETLLERVQHRGLLREAEVKGILLKTLPILETVHQQGLIHRDIKPDNVILRQSDGDPVLIDFGAVKETMGTTMDSRGQVTQSILIGTPGFMAAEQAAGHPVYSSDLYSLGLTAIYLLTGKAIPELKLNPKTAEVLWREQGVRVSPQFAQVLDQTVQFHPRDRFSSAPEMLATLEASSSAIPPTEPSLPPSTIIIPKSRPPQKQAVRYFRQLSRRLSQLKTWQKASLAGILAGTILGLGLAFGPESPEEEENLTPVEVGITNLPLSFYFIADSAFNDPGKAEQKQQELIAKGYPNAGFFWQPNYVNLERYKSYKVYTEWFNTKAECEAALPAYQAINSVAHCGFATKSLERKPPQN